MPGRTDLNLFVCALLHKGALQTAAGNQTNANSGCEMEMTAKHQKSLSGTSRAKGVVLMFTTTLIIFFLLFQFEQKLGRCVMYGVILFFSPFNMPILIVGWQ